MKVTTLFAILVIFSMGWMLNDIFAEVTSEEPSIIRGDVVAGLPKEKASPSNIISEDDIHVYSNKIVIEVDDPEWAKFTDTNSMDPVFDEGANALQIVPDTPEVISEGDIISFTIENEKGVIIHRVVEIGEDEEGWYAITKGDNNNYTDPGKVRFENIKKLLIGIIY